MPITSRYVQWYKEDLAAAAEAARKAEEDAQAAQAAEKG